MFYEIDGPFLQKSVLRKKQKYREGKGEFGFSYKLHKKVNGNNAGTESTSLKSCSSENRFRKKYLKEM